MSRKRKACAVLDEETLRDKVDCGSPGGTLLKEKVFIPALPPRQLYDSQTIGGAVETSKDTLQHPMGGASTMSYMSDPGNEAVTNEGGGSSNHRGKNSKTTKSTRISEEARLKKMIVNCEWNMCTLEFNKMERFISHITEHLQAMTDPVSNDGHLCCWRECDFACSTKEEMDRHVYFHAFHGKIKSIGALLMEERNEKCILDSSGRNMVPEIPEFFQCMWEDCTIKFASAHDYYCHTLSHVKNTDKENSNKKAFECAWNGCSSSFAVQARLRDHVRSHTQEKVVGCPNCGVFFASNLSFFDHCFRQIPLESQEYQCSHCSRRYASERLLRFHMRNHINLFKCSKCDITLPSKAKLAVHTSYCHKKEKPYKCKQCGKRFTFPQDVTRHLSVHSAEPAYGCPFQDCEYKYRSSTALNRHIKVVHNGFDMYHYACHVCDSRFTIGHSLTKHLMKIHNFKWPAGHKRFRYKHDEDGFYRLQTVRYESIELNEMASEGEDDEEAVDSPEASTYPSSPASLSTQSS